MEDVEFIVDIVGNVKQEPEADYVLELPPADEEPAPVGDDEPSADEEPPLNNVKQEPEVDYVLELPPADDDESDTDACREVSVELKKFDQKWSAESRLFQAFPTCQHCRQIFKADHKGNISQHQKSCPELLKKLNPELVKFKMKRFSCDLCPNRYKFKCDLKKHIKYHTPKTFFHCPKCKKGFKEN